MRDFTIEQHFDGDGAKALDAALATLIANDYRIVSRSADELVLKGPRQHIGQELTRFWGASRVCIRHRKHALLMQVELGEYTRSNRIGIWIVVAIFAALWIGIAGGLSITKQTMSSKEAMVFTAIAVLVPALSLLLGRWCAGYQANNLKEAFETLIANAAILGTRRQ